MEFLVHMFLATHGLAALFLIPLLCLLNGLLHAANATCERVTEWEAYRKATKAEAKRLAKWTRS